MSRIDRRVADWERPAQPRNWVATTLALGVISIMAGGAGFVVPHVINGNATPLASIASLATSFAPGKKQKTHESGQQAVCVPFGEVVVNLAEERLTRHLQVRITLLVQGPDAELVQESLQENRAVLMN